MLLLTGIVLCAAVLRFVQLDAAPSGGHGDVSWIGINALDWVDRGIVPFYIRELYSPEFFPIYATGILLPLIGISYLPQRIFTAAMGVLFVALLYPMTTWLVGGDRSEGFCRRAGLFAALAGALSVHIIGLNRLGMESPPFLTTLALLTWLTARAWRQDGEPGSLLRWSAAGAVLALNQYVYLPARLLPVVLVLWMLHLLVTQRERFLASLRGWIVMAVVSFVLTLPALVLFVYAPEAFSGRADSGSAVTGGWVWLYDTSAYGGLFALFMQKVGLTLQGIIVSFTGAYTIMGLQVFSPLFAIGFVVSVAFLFRAWRQIAFIWCAIAIGVLLITDLISGAVPEIHALHQMGTLPFLCVLSGLGLAWLWDVVFPAVQRSRWALPLLYGVVGVAAFAPTLIQMSQYLREVIPSEYADPQWSWRKAQTDVDLGRYVSQHNDQAFLLPYSEYIRPDVAWTLAAGFRQRTSAIDGDGVLRIPNPPATITVIHMTEPERPRHDGYPARPDARLWVLLHDNTVYLLPPLTSAQASAVAGDGERTPLTDASRTEIAQLVTMPTPDDLFAPRLVIDHPRDAVMDGRVRLLGYSAPVDALEPGLAMHVTLYWQALQPLPFDYEVFAQFWTDDAEAVATAHVYPYSGMYRARIWEMDEVVATHHYLEIPEDAQPGRYTLVAGLFRYLLNESVSVAGVDADEPLDVARAAVLRLPLPPGEAEAAPITPVVFGEQLQLRGLELTHDGALLREDTILPGSSLDFTITWEALSVMPADYSLFIHLVAALDTAPVAQVDAVIGGRYPTGIWQVGERVTSRVRLLLPADMQPGTYPVVIGVYDWRSGARLPLPDGTSAHPLPVALTVGE